MAHLEDFGKETYFEEHGYTWDARIEAYVSKSQWKIFTREYIDDHPFDTLLLDLQEEPVPNQWKTYVNAEAPLDIHNVHKHYGAGIDRDL